MRRITSQQKKTKFQLTLTAKQAFILVDALDLYSDIGMQQLEAIQRVLCFNFAYKVPDIDDEISSMKTKLGQPRHGSWGIGSPKVRDAAKIAYDLQCVIQNLLAEIYHDSQFSTWRNSPLHLGSEPLAKIKEIG